MLRSELVSVIVSNYNGIDLLKECLPTVVGQTWANMEILLADDASNDDSVRWVKKNYPDITVAGLKVNQGYAAVNNFAVSQAKGRFVFLLNNDVRLPENCISVLMEVMLRNICCAVAGPRINNLDMDMSSYSRNGTMNLTGNMIQNIFSDQTMVFGISGCAVLFRKDLLGLPFDDEYVFFHEDVYLSWRARLIGYDVLSVPEISVEHLGSMSVKNLGEKNIFFMERNRLLNIKIFYSGKTLGRIWPLRFLMWMTRLFSDLIKRRSRKPLRAAAAWIKSHSDLIGQKRESIQNMRVVEDAEIIKYMSYRIINNDHWMAKVLNQMARLWCRMTGLKTWELQ